VRSYVLLSIAALLVPQESKQAVQVEGPDGVYEIELPKEWEAKVIKPGLPGPPTLRIFAVDHSSLSLEMTFMALNPARFES